MESFNSKHLMQIIVMFKRSGFLKCQYAAFLLLALCIVSGCKNSPTKIEETDEVEKLDTAKTVKKKHMVFRSIPSPLQISALLKQAGAKYVSGILLSPANAGKYATTYSKSVVVGIYGSDLAYSNIYGQTQQGVSYIEAIMKVSDGLGLSAMLSSSDVLNRFQQNMNNQDSLFSIVSELYRETDVSLKENKQSNSAALILAGGWVEGLYIATRLAKATPNKNLTSRIAELKFSLNSLLGSLEELKGTNTYTPLITRLEAIKSTYDQVSLSYKEKVVATNEAARTTTLNGSSETHLTPEQLQKLTDQVGDLRASLVAIN
jgi:hypothetical protein